MSYEINKYPSIVFMGTPEFAVPALEAVHKKFGIKAVVTVPDKQKGRGQKMIPSPIKQRSMELKLPVLQPDSLKETKFIETIKALEPDIIVVIAFRILPVEVFSISKIGTFNIHASLLPKYRGAAPINWAIINGEEITGLTSFLLEEKVDTGNILLQNSIIIPENSTAGDLHDLLMPLAADIAMDTCSLLLNGNYKKYPQDNSKVSTAPKIFPEQCQINWAQHAFNLKNFIHGVSPVPGAWTLWDNIRFKIYRVEYSACGSGNPGEYSIQNNNMLVQCQKGIISILELQPSGKKIMNISEFLRGYRGKRKGILV